MTSTMTGLGWHAALYSEETTAWLSNCPVIKCGGDEVGGARIGKL